MKASHLQSAAVRERLAQALRTTQVAPESVARLSAPSQDTGDSLLGDSFDGQTSQEFDWVSRPKGLEELHRRGINGEGVTVAVVDSGVSKHSDFGDRIKAFRDFSSRKRTPYDPKGHGTHIAGIIAGENDRVSGIAPRADLVACRITNEQEAIRAIDWVIENREKYSIDILNLSLGTELKGSPVEDDFVKAAERAVEAGLVVVAAAGNECRDKVCPSNVSSPGISPKVITVGTLDDRGTEIRSDDGVWENSSRGAKDSGKPDLIAEGVRVLGPLAPASAYAQRLAQTAQYVALTGSSQAAPMVSGAAALLLQVNPNLSHHEVKDILTGTAQRLSGVPKNAQGAGRLNLLAAVDRAAS